MDLKRIEEKLDLILEFMNIKYEETHSLGEPGSYVPAYTGAHPDASDCISKKDLDNLSGYTYRETQKVAAAHEAVKRSPSSSGIINTLKTIAVATGWGFNETKYWLETNYPNSRDERY